MLGVASSRRRQLMMCVRGVGWCDGSYLPSAFRVAVRWASNAGAGQAYGASWLGSLPVWHHIRPAAFGGLRGCAAPPGIAPTVVHFDVFKIFLLGA